MPGAVAAGYMHVLGVAARLLKTRQQLPEMLEPVTWASRLAASKQVVLAAAMQANPGYDLPRSVGTAGLLQGQGGVLYVGSYLGDCCMCSGG